MSATLRGVLLVDDVCTGVDFCIFCKPEKISRKGAKAQSLRAFLNLVASSHLCVSRKFFSLKLCQGVPYICV